MNDPSWPRLLGVAAGVLLLLGVVGLAFVDDDATPQAGPPVAAPSTLPAPAVALDAPTTTAPTAPRPAPTTSTPAPPPDGSMTFAGRARSVAYEGRIGEIAAFRLADDSDLLVSGEFFDGAGNPIGQGTVRATGAGLSVNGDGIVYRGPLTATRSEVRLTGAGELDLPAAARIASPKLFFSPSDGSGQHDVASPVSVRNPTFTRLTLDQSRVQGLPATLELGPGGGRVTLSWAGSGQIVAAGRTFSSQWLGVKASDLHGTLSLRTLELSGGGQAQQVYAGGQPQLRAEGTWVNLSTPPAPVRAGEKGEFAWAPHNDGRVDMTITKLRPATPQASWINIALEPLPAMYGGEPRQPPGGDTSGFGNRGSGGFFGSTTAVPINSVILPRTADKRSISFDVPAGTAPGRYQMVVEFQGNFEPIKLVVPVQVT